MGKTPFKIAHEQFYWCGFVVKKGWAFGFYNNAPYITPFKFNSQHPTKFTLYQGKKIDGKWAYTKIQEGWDSDLFRMVSLAKYPGIPVYIYQHKQISSINSAPKDAMWWAINHPYQGGISR